jgi:hypothetical protein
MMTAVATSLDESTVTELVRPCHPVASVYFGPPPNPAVDPEVEWHARMLAMAHQLRGGGMDPAAIERVAELASPLHAATGAALFATTEQALECLRLPELTAADFAGYAAPTHVVPLLAWLQRRPPYLLVLTDRTGADLHASRGGGDRPRVLTVDGPDDEIERNAPGGWSQPRYQNRAEDSWRHNAAAVAEACRGPLRETGARLLIVSGDVRAVQLLEEHLPASVRGQVTIRHLTGGRHPDGSERHRADRVADVAAAAADDVTQALLTRFAEQRGPRGLAVEGRSATLTALAQGRLDTLLVVPGTDGGRFAWFGPQPTQLAPGDTAPPTGWPEVHRGPVIDVAIRAALLAGAHVRILEPDLPGNPADGIGGLCRFR